MPAGPFPRGRIGVIVAAAAAASRVTCDARSEMMRKKEKKKRIHIYIKENSARDQRDSRARDVQYSPCALMARRYTDLYCYDPT